MVEVEVTAFAAKGLFRRMQERRRVRKTEVVGKEEDRATPASGVKVWAAIASLPKVMLVNSFARTMTVLFPYHTGAAAGHEKGSNHCARHEEKKISRPGLRHCSPMSTSRKPRRSRPTE